MKFLLEYPGELKQELKVYAAKTQQSMTEIIIQSIKEYLEKNKQVQ